MKEIKIENLIIYLLTEGSNVRVKSGMENIILSNQNIDKVSDLITHNFNVVNYHYKLMISGKEDKFASESINHLSIAIVMHYLYMYNSWRNIYKKQEDKDLNFNEKDFNNPSTHDIILNYFKIKHENDWEEKCSILLAMNINALKEYYKTRQNFYNK